MNLDELGRGIGWVGGVLFLLERLAQHARGAWWAWKREKQDRAISECLADGGHRFRQVEYPGPTVPLPPLPVDGKGRPTWLRCDRCGVHTAMVTGRTGPVPCETPPKGPGQPPQGGP